MTTLRGLITRLPVEQAEKIKRAAAEVGCSQEEFCRRVLVDSADRVLDTKPTSLAGQVQKIYDHLMPNGTLKGVEGQALSILVQLQMPKKEAIRKIRMIAEAEPKLSAQEIVARATKPAE